MNHDEVHVIILSVEEFYLFARIVSYYCYYYEYEYEYYYYFCIYNIVHDS